MDEVCLVMVVHSLGALKVVTHDSICYSWLKVLMPFLCVQVVALIKKPCFATPLLRIVVANPVMCICYYAYVVVAPFVLHCSSIFNLLLMCCSFASSIFVLLLSFWPFCIVLFFNSYLFVMCFSLTFDFLALLCYTIL